MKPWTWLDKWIRAIAQRDGISVEAAERRINEAIDQRKATGNAKRKGGRRHA